jgi:hypothetical protein
VPGSKAKADLQHPELVVNINVEAPLGWDETDYLARNPDVGRAVAASGTVAPKDVSPVERRLLRPWTTAAVGAFQIRS